MRFLFSTVGSLGDLYPLLSVAQALRAMGHEVIFAVHGDQVGLVEAEGFKASRNFGGLAELAQDLGLSEEEVIRRCFAEPHFLFRKVLASRLEEVTEMLLDELGEIDLVAATFQSEAARLFAERRGRPAVRLLLQPMLVFDPTQAPILPGAPPMLPRAKGLGILWNKAIIAMALWVTRAMHGHRINRPRAALGLPKHKGAPWFQTAVPAPMTLGLYPEFLHDHPPQMDPPHICTGICAYDGAEQALDPELEAFLENGDPPIVFTLGSNAEFLRGDFYAQSVKAARALGRRSVLLTGAGWRGAVSGPDVIQRDYVPHQLIFHRAEIIVHHGGIGTVSRALLAGRAQLIVPFGTDQPDNAARIRARGLGLALPAKKYNARRAQKCLSQLLNTPAFAQSARAVAAKLDGEDGALRAANLLIDAARR